MATDNTQYSMNAFEKVMSSAPICWYSKYIVGPLIKKACPMPDELASSDYQSFGELAQQKIGLAKDRMIPIKKMPADYSERYKIQASTEPDAIYINEYELNKHSPIYRWHSSLHEASHHKFNHVAVPFIWVPVVSVMLFVDIPLKFLTPKGLGESGKIIRALVNSALLLYCTKKILTKSNQYLEFRADMHALAHLDCYKCAEIIAETRGNNPEVHTRGYLNYDDIMTVAQKYKDKEMICAYHQK
jgi:hypothetical protein